MDINIGILIAQLVNFALILWLFKKLIGDKITANIIKRRAELAKAEDATKIYEETMLQAEQEKKLLIEEGLTHKQKLINEAKQTAQQKADTIIASAEKSAHAIAQKAEEHAEQLEKHLQHDFVDSVKTTACLVVKKLVGSDKKLQDDYLTTLTHEFTK